MFPKALILYLGTSGAKPRDYPCSYTFLLIHLCRNVSVRFYLCFTRQLRWICEKKLTKKIIFYRDYEALKVFRKYRCHPVYIQLRTSLSLFLTSNFLEIQKGYFICHFTVHVQ
jgi:hypothetical protein